MIKLFVFVVIINMSFILQSIAQPKPSKAQLNWHKMEFNLFMHFGPNTFTGAEWGTGNEKTEVFNPTNLDCEQWCSTAKNAGAKGIIITAKHHDGFCLWPSQYSTHTVKQSKWKNGKGDVLKELSKACKKYKLKFGVYISPWDRNHPDYGTEKYNAIFVAMMNEIFTNYGPIFELWWDGANGEGPNGKVQEYDWKKFASFVKKKSPNTVIFSDIGPHIRWVGNENGFASNTNYNTLNTDGFGRGAIAPAQDSLGTGNYNGKNWIPAECDVSIRPGWFYHKEENDKVKTAKELLQLYFASVNRGAVLLLNVPPTDEGKIYYADSLQLVAFKNLKNKLFANNLLENAATYVLPKNNVITKEYKNKKVLKISNSNLQNIRLFASNAPLLNTIILKEDITNGQHCNNGKIMLYNASNELVKTIAFTTIGIKKMICFKETIIQYINIEIEKQNGKTEISKIEGYYLPTEFIEKEIE